MNATTAKAKFIDNIIPFKKGIFGEQTAGWQPGPPAMSGMGCQIIADQMVPMADGIFLGADIYLPKKAGRYPAILVFGAYTKELHAAGIPAGTNEVGSPPVFTDRGYAHVIVTRRGMGRSEGKTGVFFGDQDVDDHEATIAWAAAQPWCDGQVVMFGISYFGCTQPQVAVRRPPALRGFFCDEICTDYFRHITAFGGTPGVYFLNLWTGANFTQSIVNLRIAPVVRALLSWILNTPLKKVWWPQMQKRLPAIQKGFMTHTPVREVRDQIANWLFDGKTRATNAIGTGPYANLANVDVPFVTIQNLGQFNLHQFGSYDLFLHASTPADRKWLILGKPTYQLPVFGWQIEALAFFDHVTRGTANGYADQARVRYWLDGPDRYASATSFPPSDARKQRLFLKSGGDDATTHRLSNDAPEGGRNSWAAVPRGATLVGGMDEVINQRLTYDMPILQSTELTGAVTANLKFSCNEIDSYLLARLGRVDALGGYTTAKGFRRATSVQAALTGLGGDIFIIDDPQKPIDTMSDALREKLNHWFSNTLRSRLDNKETGIIIVVMQRIHLNDLTGYLIEKSDDWTVLSLSAIAEQDELVPIGSDQFHSRREGEALHPAYESLATLKAMQHEVGTEIFSAQYQQAPIPSGGSIIRREWLKYYNDKPSRSDRSRVIQSWDTAAKAGAKNDWSVCTTWQIEGKHFYLLNVKRGRFDYASRSLHFSASPDFGVPT